MQASSSIAQSLLAGIVQALGQRYADRAMVAVGKRLAEETTRPPDQTRIRAQPPRE